MTFKSVKKEVKAWKPTQDGDSIVGRFIRKEDGSGTYSNRYIIAKQIKDNSFEDDETTIYGSVVLDELFAEVKPDDLIKVIFEGKVKSKSSGRMVNKFDLQVDRPEVQKVKA